MSPDTIRQLAQNCRRKDMRSLGFPRDWQPYKIQNPEFPGYTFTDISAWEFIADKLEQDPKFDVIPLDNPKGAKALVMKIPLPSDQVLYIKVQIGSGIKAIGRSFHVSDIY